MMLSQLLYCLLLFVIMALPLPISLSLCLIASKQRTNEVMLCVNFLEFCQSGYRAALRRGG